MKYFLLLLIPTIAFGQFYNPIGGIDFDHDPTYRRSFEPENEEVKSCSVVREDREFLLNKKNYSLEDLFSLVSTTESGKEVVKEIEKLLHDKKLKIVNFSNSIRLSRGLSKKTVALYDFTLKTPTIFINFEDEIGLAAHFFVHEATHALDDLIPEEYEVDMIYYKAYKDFQKLFGLDTEPMKDLTPYQTEVMERVWDTKELYRNIHSYRAERFAFDQQGVFTEDILNFDDCYMDYVEEHKKVNGLKLYVETPDSHIFSAYGIDRKYIQK